MSIQYHRSKDDFQKVEQAGSMAVELVVEKRCITSSQTTYIMTQQRATRSSVLQIIGVKIVEPFEGAAMSAVATKVESASERFRIDLLRHNRFLIARFSLFTIFPAFLPICRLPRALL